MPKKGKGTKVYAAYRGEKYLYDGTKRELAEFLKIPARKMDYLATPSVCKRAEIAGAKSNTLALFFIGYEEELLEECCL